MSTYKNIDRCTDILLDFISGPESGGNYNAYFGHGKSTSPSLVSMSLDQVYAFQYQMTGGSTAIGRYQFLLATLQGLQDQLNLPDSAIFDEPLQDRMGVALLVRRGYSAWWRVRISDSELAHRMSMEWASLPDPQKDGRSYYDKDSMNNRAGTTLDAVFAMLERARAAQQEMASIPATPPPVTAPGLAAADIKRLTEIAAAQVDIASAQSDFAEELMDIMARVGG